jgi:hypothetical protein
MGAIVSDLPQLPGDADPDRVRLYTGIYADLTALGLALPAQAANAVTRAQLLAHLQGIIGAAVKAELAGDPDGVGYAGGDAAKAVAIATSYVLGGVRRFPGTNLTGYQVAAGSTVAGVAALTNPGLANPAFLSVNGLALVGAIRFRLTAATVANRGVVMPILAAPTDNTLTFSAPLPGAPTVGDIFDIGLAVPPRQAARLNQILARIPHAPNALTVADITAAQV